MIPFKDMPPHSRAWIYQGSRELNVSELRHIKERAEEFITGWTSHNQQMLACIETFHNWFVVVCADERTAPASGCGIDKAVRFIMELEKELNLSLTGRMNTAYRKGGKIFSCPLDELKTAGAETVFNNLVQTKAEMETNWEIPPAESWHSRFL